ncbi:hypothetical protein [Chamaesiphon minutus]|uniref:Uncharacterized protein n=1 Tax=Chamaesiphon minutus (strain ATCC 27169 / PCC 6605) TaxID=1173020 RepID=K9UFY0_CHAP6|nr:hypothetical protein [Chamaesiphon minutus]AFY93119.1 hypothetical protein Cha6605_2018 [Chamaesiphon minutus PCC 6605]
MPCETAYLLPYERNKPNATYWLEADNDELFYKKILEDFEVELSDFWDGEPYW